jgi:hypothetical protein
MYCVALSSIEVQLNLIFFPVSVLCDSSGWPKLMCLMGSFHWFLSLCPIYTLLHSIWDALYICDFIGLNMGIIFFTGM